MNHRCLDRALLLCLAVCLTGCATQYGCKGMPEDPQCLSTTEAYQATDKALLEPKEKEVVSPGSTSIEPGPRQQPVPKIDDPTPIRTPSQVMRIWIAPWEDAEGDLMVSNYVYTELEPRRWMIGKGAPTLSPTLMPLQIEQRPPEKPVDRDLQESDTRPFPPGAVNNSAH